MPEKKKIPKMERLPLQEARYKHATHISILKKNIGKVEKLKKKIINKKGKIKPEIRR